MFSLFPCDWEQPKPKWLVKEEQPNMNDIIVQRPIVPKINLPNASVETNALNVSVPNVKRGPNVKVKNPVFNIADVCPAREMLKPGEEIDTTEIDRMLDEISWEIEEDCSDANTKRIMQMIKTVNGELIRNLDIIQNANPHDGNNIKREEIIELLKMFLNYSQTLENYLKTKQHTK